MKAKLGQRWKLNSKVFLVATVLENHKQKILIDNTGLYNTEQIVEMYGFKDYFDVFGFTLLKNQDAPKL